jgi:glucose/mannose-6-phosphate isomerase
MKIYEYVAKYDPQNQFEVLIKTHEQIEFAWNNKIDVSSLKNFSYNSIVVTGLGGSAISADLMQNFLGAELKIPFVVNRNYHLPNFVGKDTLLVVSSYSGNTEETVSVFYEALKSGCKIVCITTGGKVEKIATENKILCVKIYGGLQPRYALGLSFFSLLKVLQEIGIIGDQNEVVKKIISLWKENGAKFSQEDSKPYNYAQQLVGYIPVIYSAADVTSAVGYRFKCQFNENSKLHAFHNVFPELNHNEIVGWESYLEKQFSTKVLNIIDKVYHPQIAKRFKITSELIAKNKVDVINLESSHEDFKVRIMDLIYLGDWITYYAALLRDFDPTEIDNINTLKKSLE